jgi:hypothetical protein
MTATPLHVCDAPVVCEFGDLQVVLLEHDHVAVTANAPLLVDNQLELGQLQVGFFCVSSSRKIVSFARCLEPRRSA